MPNDFCRGSRWNQMRQSLYLPSQLKPNAYNNKARLIWFHRLPRQKSLGIAQKVRHFLILVPKTAMIYWLKIVEHTDGTSSAERGCNTDWTLGLVHTCFNFLGSCCCSVAVFWRKSFSASADRTRLSGQHPQLTGGDTMAVFVYFCPILIIKISIFYPFFSFDFVH